MSIHANQARSSAPKAASAPAGANATYKTHVQKAARRNSQTDKDRDHETAGTGTKQKSGIRSTETTSVTRETAKRPTTGDGHYHPQAQ